MSESGVGTGRLRRWANIGPEGVMQEHPLGEFVLLADVRELAAPPAAALTFGEWWDSEAPELKPGTSAYQYAYVAFHAALRLAGTRPAAVTDALQRKHENAGDVRELSPGHRCNAEKVGRPDPRSDDSDNAYKEAHASEVAQSPGINPQQSIPESGAPSSEAGAREALRTLRNAPLSKYIGPHDYTFSSQDDMTIAMGLGRDLANGIFDAVERTLAEMPPVEAPVTIEDVELEEKFAEAMKQPAYTLAEMPPSVDKLKVELNDAYLMVGQRDRMIDRLKNQIAERNSGGDRAMAGASEVLNVAKARLEEATNWHQFGKEHDEDGWCCKREADLRNTVMAIQQLQEAPLVGPEAGGSSPAQLTQRKIVFNWLMGEDDLSKSDGYWGGSDEVAYVDQLLTALAARREPEQERVRE
jgi:hypothetical protein